MRPDTLAEAVERIQAGAARDVELAEFVDTFDLAKTNAERSASIERAPELMGDVLPRALCRRFSVLCHSSCLAKPGQESAQYASIAAADSIVPFVMPDESIHHLAIQILELDMFVLKPSTEIGDHHDLISDRVPRIALLG